RARDALRPGCTGSAGSTSGPDRSEQPRRTLKSLRAGGALGSHCTYGALRTSGARRAQQALRTSGARRAQ
ncbi:MAG: hypothetical protein QOK04_167, partial [Solirubrobacteraceae bacterium]|nr:hypothetical protein [Solirubrobacteraceae bacterium]